MNQGRDAHFEPARNHILASLSEDLLRADRDFREAVSGRHPTLGAEFDLIPASVVVQ